MKVVRELQKINVLGAQGYDRAADATDWAIRSVKTAAHRDGPRKHSERGRHTLNFVPRGRPETLI